MGAGSAGQRGRRTSAKPRLHVLACESPSDLLPAATATQLDKQQQQQQQQQQHALQMRAGGGGRRRRTSPPPPLLPWWLPAPAAPWPTACGARPESSQSPCAPWRTAQRRPGRPARAASRRPLLPRSAAGATAPGTAAAACIAPAPAAGVQAQASSCWCASGARWGRAGGFGSAMAVPASAGGAPFLGLAPHGRPAAWEAAACLSCALNRLAGCAMIDPGTAPDFSTHSDFAAAAAAASTATATPGGGRARARLPLQALALQTYWSYSGCTWSTEHSCHVHACSSDSAPPATFAGSSPVQLCAVLPRLLLRCLAVPGLQAMNALLLSLPWACAAAAAPASHASSRSPLRATAAAHR